MYPFDYEAIYLSNYIRKQRILESSTGILTEIQSYIIDSCLARNDEEEALKLIGDWNAQRSRASVKSEYVSKWNPGDHFYALDEKFPTLKKAIGHLRKNGYEYAGLKERFQYKEQGG